MFHKIILGILVNNNKDIYPYFSRKSKVTIIDLLE